jgi:hypothetical protein
MVSSDAAFFLKAANAAFPSSCRALAEDAAGTLAPFVNDVYRQSSVQVMVHGEAVQIPKRIYFSGLDEGGIQVESRSEPLIQCLCTRSANGYLRHAALRRILAADEVWVIPYVVLLAGGYVAEIIEDMVASLAALNRCAYINFVLENRPVMRLLQSQAMSYWDCYYRGPYPDRSTYPGLAFLHQLELWAS